MPSTTSADELLAPRAVLGWTLFSLAAGTVNGAAFMACHGFVTHVTGSVTNVGLDATNSTLVIDYALVVLAFLFGAMLAVVIAETLPGRQRVLGLALLLVFGLLVAVAVAGSAGAFGPFGAKNSETRGAFTLLVLLAGAMGIQNGAVALVTGNTVRTTHLTGPTTDLGANIVRAVLGRGMGAPREARWALLRFVKILAFAVGAALAARYAPRLEYNVFLVPAIFVVLAAGFTFAPQETTPPATEEPPTTSAEADEVPVPKNTMNQPD
jgi:uncharacterized membrane protein YoaK (UPF0700 family)